MISNSWYRQLMSALTLSVQGVLRRELCPVMICDVASMISCILKHYILKNISKKHYICNYPQSIFLIIYKNGSIFSFTQKLLNSWQ